MVLEYIQGNIGWQQLKNIYHFIVVGVCTFRQFQQNAPSQNRGNDTSEAGLS